MATEKSQLAQLIDLMLEEQKKRIDEGQLTVAMRRACQFPTWWEQQCQAYNRIKACPHFKGAAGRGGSKTQGTRGDYNVLHHNFPLGKPTKQMLDRFGQGVWDIPGCSYQY